MARILFAAHDSGGANMLEPVADALRAAGHEVRLLADGPAVAVWPGGAVEEGTSADTSRLLADVLRAFRPDLAVTGTSETADFERTLWRKARKKGVRSMAAIDAWMNLRERFVANGVESQPDALLVIDEGMRAEIERAGWCRARVYVGGQPHLERQATRLRRLRAGRPPGNPRLLAYFSEPIAERGAGKRLGYDQFAVAGMIVKAAAAHAPLRLRIRPHPKEGEAAWREWLGGRAFPPGLDVALADPGTEALLATADCVASPASMVLLEAAVAGIPALAAQPNRRYRPNPAIDGMPGIRLVTGPADLAPALAEVLAMADGSAGAAVGPFAGSTEAFLAAIESELRGARR